MLGSVDPAEVLLRTPIFRDLRRRDVEELLPDLRQRSYARGESVWLEGAPADALYLIVHGQLKSYRLSRDGNEVILLIQTSGDVAGEVGDPGVYRLPAGSRVTDAVQRAGGATAKGDLEQINLAARLADGQQVVIPGRVQASAGVAAGATSVGDGPISVGTATLEELDTIEGIGPVTAQSILDYRNQHGGVSSIDQLDEIDGIGPATMDSLRARLQP